MFNLDATWWKGIGLPGGDSWKIYVAGIWGGAVPQTETSLLVELLHVILQWRWHCSSCHNLSGEYHTDWIVLEHKRHWCHWWTLNWKWHHKAVLLPPPHFFSPTALLIEGRSRSAGTRGSLLGYIASLVQSPWVFLRIILLSFSLWTCSWTYLISSHLIPVQCSKFTTTFSSLRLEGGGTCKVKHRLSHTCYSLQEIPGYSKI